MEDRILLLLICTRGRADAVMEAARAAGSPGGTILQGRGTCAGGLMGLLGLGDDGRDLLTMHIEVDSYEAIHAAIMAVSPLRGVFATIGEKENKTMPTEWKLIQVICNSGYADDIMVAARKAGAGGGTIVDGRGTSKPGDETFFGTCLVPEKEVLLMLVERTKADDILTAISSLSCLQAPGSGIVFTLPVDTFERLGEKK